MASTRTELSPDLEPVQAINTAPSGFDPARDLPVGFIEFLLPFHRAFSPRQRDLIGRRAAALAASHDGQLPDYLPASRATTDAWQIELPDWCQDQRNQMTGPADDAELVVKMLNSGAPGVMLDLEDSMANTWPHLTQEIGRASCRERV
jgi:malate synthase